MLITCNQSCRAVLILLTAAAGPPQTCPRRGGEGGERQKKSSAFLLCCGRICAFLSSCMEIIPIGGNCFPGEGIGGGGPRVSGGRGSLGAPKGRSILSGCRGREAGSLLQLLVSLQGPWMHPAPGMRQAAPRCPRTSHRSSASPLLPLIPHGAGSWTLWAQPGAAGGMPGGAEGQSPLPSLLPSLGPLPSTASSGGCWPSAIPAASFPEAAGQQPEPRSGSNPWL